MYCNIPAAGLRAWSILGFSESDIVAEIAGDIEIDGPTLGYGLGGVSPRRSARLIPASNQPIDRGR